MERPEEEKGFEKGDIAYVPKENADGELEFIRKWKVVGKTKDTDTGIEKIIVQNPKSFVGENNKNQYETKTVFPKKIRDLTDKILHPDIDLSSFIEEKELEQQKEVLGPGISVHVLDENGEKKSRIIRGIIKKDRLVLLEKAVGNNKEISIDEILKLNPHLYFEE